MEMGGTKYINLLVNCLTPSFEIWFKNSIPSDYSHMVSYFLGLPLYKRKCTFRKVYILLYYYIYIIRTNITPEVEQMVNSDNMIKLIMQFNNFWKEENYILSVDEDIGDIHIICSDGVMSNSIIKHIMSIFKCRFVGVNTSYKNELRGVFIFN